MRSSLDRRLELRRRPNSGLAQRRRHVFGQHHRRPVRGRGDAAERQRVVGIAAAADLAARRARRRRRSTLSCLAAMALSLSRICAAAMCAATAVPEREAAGIGAGGDRPLILRGVDFQHHFDVVGLQARARAATICASTVSWLWPCTVTSAVTDTAPSGSILTRRHRHRAVLGPGLFARLRASSRSRDSPCSTSPARPRRQSRCRICARRRALRRAGA